MKTFTTYAEKKAKQFLNLLQGYTKGIRITALLILFVMGVNNAWAATIFNCGIEVNETWYKGTGTINSGNWLGNQTAFNNKDFGVITSLMLGGQYDTWDNNQTDNCSWNASNGITITIKKGSTQKDQFKLSCYHSGKDGNNNVWKTTGTIGQCGDKNAYGRYTHNISQYAAGNDYTIAAKWFSPSGISTTGTAKFTIPGFTTTSNSQTFESTLVGNNNSKTISFGTHYGTTLKTNNCSISGANYTEFSVTSINESGVTVQFKPTSAGSKTATLTITDAHSKKCTIELSGTATLPTYTVTFNANGHGTAPAAQTVSQGSKATQPTAPTATGYTFGGWYKEAGCTNAFDFNTAINANITLYAKWTPKTYTITLDANGGTSNGSATATYNSSTITNLTHPTRTDYRCNGYYTAASGGTLVLNTDGTLAKNVGGYTDANGNWIKDAAVTLYAQWAYDVTEYTVTFGVGTGSASYGSLTAYNNTTSASITSPAQVRSQHSVTFTATPEPGYLVEGWYTNAACTEGKHDAGNTTYTPTITAATNVYVKFVEKTWPVTVAAGTGGSVSPSGSQTVGQVTGISINANHDNGYTFNKWTITSGNGTLTDAKSASTTFKPTSDATVEASFNETLSTLTTSNNYTEGNPSYDAPTVTKTKIGVATTAQVTATTPSGAYAFTGWTLTNCERTDTGDATALSITVRSMGDGAAAIVTANYEKIPSKTVYFKPKTEWKNNNPVIICDGTSTPVTPYACAGEYYTAEVPGGTTNLKFGGDNEQTLPLTVPADDKVLYDMTETKITALYLKPGDWDKDGAWFAVYLCNGTDASSWHKMKKIEGTELYGVEIESSKLNSTKNKNVIFVRMDKNKSTLDWSSKWNQSKDLNMPTNGTNQCTISDHWSNSNASGSWHKVWDNSCWKEFTTPTYNITLDQPTGGTIAVSKSSDITLNEQVTVTMTADPGYSFQSGTIKIGTQEPQTITEIESTYTICGPTTITAKWKPDTHTVTFDANGHGTAPDEQSVDHNEKVTKPDDLTATGYTFGGWYKEENCTNVWDFNNDVVTADITLYAKWTAIKYKIEYTELYDVTHNNPTEYTIESETITFAAPTSTRNGYTFAGWNPAKIEKGSTDDKTVTAQWTEILSTITIKTNPAEGGSIEVDGQPFTPGNTVQVGVATFKLVTAVPKEGYDVAQWGIKGSATFGGGSTTFKLYGNGTDAAGELIANFIGKEYTITFDRQDGTGGTEKATVNYKNNNYSVNTVEVPNRTGYTFGGYYTQADGLGVQVVSAEGAWLSNATGYTDADGKWIVHENTTLYAQWTANTYTVTLQHSTIAGYGSGGISSVTATYNAAMPTATMPTAANGYVFMGYFDGEQGAGTQYYNADGASAHVWDKAEDATLYAHFVKAEITQITLDKYTFEPVEAGGTGFVTATPTIEPTPTNDVVLCWRLLYNNGNEVPGRSAQVVSGNIVRFSIAGLAAGTYKIEAVLRTGNNCGSGDVLSTKTVNFTIASNYTITVKYTCDGKEIMAASKVTAHVSEETEITAPNIIGYTFNSWEAGDGVTIKSTNNDKVKITAIYDGYLTAKYTARPMVYFKNTLGWEKVYVYTFSDNAWWDSGIQGVHPGANKLEQGEMTQIGESDIYYFVLNNTDGDYTQDNNANRNYIAFSDVDMRTYGEFNGNKAIYRGDHKNNLTLFIPQADQTPSTTNQTKYYNKGIWMKYNSTESGYQMPTNNSVNDNPPGLGTDDGQGWSTYGNKFTAQTPGGYKFSITKHLEANKTYEFKIKNYVYVKDWEDKDNNEWYGYNENSNTITDSKCTELHFHEESDKKHNCGNAKIKTTAEGEYTFTIDLSQGKVLLSVEYPVQVGDYRVIYKDNATWSHASAHDANWYHPSRVIKKNKTSEAKLDTISFFLHRETGSTYSMKFQKCTNINSAGKVTWTDYADIPNLKDKGESGVYNFIVEQTANGESISCTDNVERYTGNYYIRVDALAGKWDNYKTTPENRMTYSAFSESEANSFGDKYSHYATKYCDEGTNIKFVIANDYSPCISDTLAQDVKVNGANPFDNLDEHGTIKSDYQQNKANVRFMWNRKTNKISRVYIGSAAEAGRHFLVLKSDKEMKGEDGNNLQNEGDNHAKHKAVFKDTQNWMYERTIKVQPGTRVKLYACYPMDNISLDAAEQKAQHFRGAYDGDTWDEENSIVILGGSGTDWNTIRVIYDFKTNRLMAALVPDQEVSGEKTIAADVMIIRKHQDAATSITLVNDDSKMKEVKTVYGSLQLNRWVLNNRKSDKSGIEYCTEKINNQDTYSESKTNEHHPVLSIGEQKSIYERALYFISFPFDVHLSDVFGFGTYGTHWVISTYNGLRRAQRGYFAEDCINEDCTNWDYIWDPSNFTLKANQGYLLSLDLDLMRYNNTDFWLHNIDQVELFFPSTANLATIEKTSYTMPALSEEYLCKINHNTDNTNPNRDRRVKDSYWRCIGVPSFADYDGSLYKSKEDAESDKYPINWNTDYTWKADESGFPFLYEWNVTDNSLSVQNTSKYQFKPTFAYLVQNGDAIYWKAVNSKPSSVIARQRTETARNYEWKIALMRDGNQEDQTFVRITDNENVTTEFDFNQDLAKEFNYGRGDIYTLIGYERVAANSMPCSDKTTIIPLGLNIEQAGDYTIAMPEGVENIGITLVDNETGIHTNLSAGQEYTLTLNNGICENRLFIEVSPIQNTPTDLEYTTEDTREQTTRKVLINEKLYIIRDGVVYDAQGHRL